MADIFRGVDGQKLERVIALNEGVQDWMDNFVFEAGVRAEQELMDHRQDGHASIEVELGDVDRYLVLSDERGAKAAMSIEYGREAYEVTDDDGNVIYEVGAMDGLYILHNAMHMPRRVKKRLRLDE